jgi:peptidyl-prolyl cis-trans isomerase D
MALIGKIRKNSWILIVLIGLGLGGFIIMDMTSGQQSVFGGNQFVVGKINGTKLEWNQFYRVENVLYGNQPGDVYGRRNFLWNYFVQEALVSKEAEKLGLGVSKPELLDLQFGPNPSSVIMQRFMDPNTQQLNRQQLNDFKQAIENKTLTDPNIIAFWAHQEKEIIKDRLQGKINALVSKALYTPTWLAEMGFIEQNQQVDFAYVRVAYDEIDNSEVALEEKDFEAYLKENRGLYTRDEESRVVEYVVFSVAPTPTDSAELREKIVELIPEFEAAENDSLFVEINRGFYTPLYAQKSDLSPSIADTLFQLPVGAVYGPYIDGGSYWAAKIVDRKTMADSADSRHILIQAQMPEMFAAAEKTIDSLKNLIERGVERFDSLAVRFSQDPGSALKGGLYEGTTPNQFVPEYNDVLFFSGEIGKLYKVRTSYGWHLIEVLRRSASRSERLKVAYISEEILPSQETQSKAYEETTTFVQSYRTLDQLRQAVSQRPDLSIESSQALLRNDFNVGSLGGGQSARDMVRWAFGAKKGEVSPSIYDFQDPQQNFTNRYAVAGLKTIFKPGLATVESVREEIEPLVINRKKAAMIKERLAGQSDLLSAAASMFNTPVDTIYGATFSQPFIPGLGTEPRVTGTVFSLEQGQTSQPVEGASGVFVVKVISRAQPGIATNIPQLRRSLSSTARAQVSMRLMEAIQKKADIEDNRARFY